MILADRRLDPPRFLRRAERAADQHSSRRGTGGNRGRPEGGAAQAHRRGRLRL